MSAAGVDLPVSETAARGAAGSDCEDGAVESTGTRPRSPWRRVTSSPWAHLAAAIVVMGLVLSFIAKPYAVPSASMEETLVPGDRILVNRVAYAGSTPRTGDVVVFDAGEAWDGPATRSSNPIVRVLRWVGEVTGFGPSSPHTLVKRVIGTPGSTVKCCSDDGRVVVDGESVDEAYVTDDFPFVPGSLDCGSVPRSTRCFGPVTVPADAYLMLGDNRAASSDSVARCRVEEALGSCWRWATREGIVGKATAILWPLPRWSGL
jgi:signal peptidase I